MANHTADVRRDGTSRAGAQRLLGRPNIRTHHICLVIWALVSLRLRHPAAARCLRASQVGGTDLGFWFAQQGSILVFLVLIFFYAWRMNRLDREYGVDEE